MPRTANETRPRQFRLGDETLAELDAIAAFLGLSSRAEAIRYAARQAYLRLGSAPKKSRKKS